MKKDNINNENNEALSPAYPKTSDGEFASISVSRGMGGFLKNTLVLSGGTAISQLMAIISAPIVTRLFSPDAFGIGAVYASIIIIISHIGSFRYESSIMLPKKDSEAANLFAVCLLIITINAAIVTLFVVFGGEAILAPWKDTALLSYSWLIPIGFIIHSAASPLRFWNQRLNQFKRIALVRITAAILMVFAVLSTGFSGFQEGIHLILARLCATISIPLILAWFLWRYDIAFMLKEVSARKMWFLMKRYRKFPLLSSWTGLIGYGAMHAPTLMLAGFFNPATAGLYALANRMLVTPTRIFATSIMEVLYQRTAEVQSHKGQLADIVERVTSHLITIGLLPLLILALIGPDIVGWIFGPKWSLAGLYTAILMPSIFTAFVLRPLAVLFFVLEKQGLDLFTRMVASGLDIGSLAIGGLVFRDPIYTLILFSAVSSLGLIWRFGYCLRDCNVPRRKIILHVLTMSGLASPILIVYGLFNWILDLHLAWNALAVLLASIPYLAYSFRRNTELSNILTKSIAKIRGTF